MNPLQTPDERKMPDRKRIGKQARFTCLILAIILLLCAPANSFADVSVDIRAAGPLRARDDKAAYSVSIGNCSNFTSVDILAGSFQETLPPSEAVRIAGSAVGCRFYFTGTGEGMLTPQITLNFRDSTSQTLFEFFFIEQNPPKLTFDGVSLQSFDGVQYLISRVQASDDVDISYIGFSVTGLRTSDLRTADGVVDKARETAFASTGGTVRVYPVTDDQTHFNLTLPVQETLDADAIAHDAMVILSVTVVDSSGNHKSLAKVIVPGGAVDEAVYSLQTMPSTITFTDMFENALIRPFVDFQFRGLTPVPGPDSWVFYLSSHPDLIAVTPDGVVYPLEETGSDQVTITVSYPGLDPVIIPVETDLSK